MTTMYVVVQQYVQCTESGFEICYSADGIADEDRAVAVRTAVEVFGHDDFNIATVTDGRLVAFGWGMDDFGPDTDGAPHGGHDLAVIAEQIGLEVAGR